MCMSIAFYILKDMLERELNYKGYRCNIFGIPTISKYKKRSIYTTLSRLRGGKYVSQINGVWKITELGKKYIERKKNPLKRFDSPFNKNSPQNLLLTFDIPEPKKYERDWFRSQLKKFNYKLIQRSVWVGPSPLPKEFVEYLKQIKLTRFIKTFKLSKSYTKKD